MQISINLYSEEKRLIRKDIICSCLGLFDFKRFQVSRTIGSGNYFELNEELIKSGILTFPREDISRNLFTDSNEVSALLVDNSMLCIEIESGSERCRRIAEGISKYSTGTANFFSSSTGFIFGPLDLCEFEEDEEGTEIVRLVAVAQFCFYLTCDDFVGDLSSLEASLRETEEFVGFRTALEKITGPLKLQIEGS